MSEPQRIHLHYCELSGTSELRLTDTGEFIYYDDHVKEIHRLQAELAAEQERTANAIYNLVRRDKENKQLTERVAVLKGLLRSAHPYVARFGNVANLSERIIEALVEE